MVKQSNDFGALVRRALEERGCSLQEAARRADGLSFGTIRNMTFGAVPGPELIVRFARAMDWDANELLDAAGVWYLRYTPDREPAEAKRGVSRRLPAGRQPVAA